MDQLIKWIGQGRHPARPSPPRALITSLFNEGKAAMVFSGPWFLGEIAKGIDYGLAPLPTLDEAGGKPMRPWMTVEGVYVAAPSKNKEAAFEFAKYLTDVPGGEGAGARGPPEPGQPGVYNDPQVAKDPCSRPSASRWTWRCPCPTCRR